MSAGDPRGVMENGIGHSPARAVTKREVCQKFGVSPDTVVNWIIKKGIQSVGERRLRHGQRALLYDMKLFDGIQTRRLGRKDNPVTDETWRRFNQVWDKICKAGEVY